MWQTPWRMPGGCTVPHLLFCQSCCVCQMVARHPDRLSQLAESCSWCLGLAYVLPLSYHSRDAGRVCVAWGRYCLDRWACREAAEFAWKLWFPSAPLVWLWKALVWVFDPFILLWPGWSWSLQCDLSGSCHRPWHPPRPQERATLHARHGRAHRTSACGASSWHSSFSRWALASSASPASPEPQGLAATPEMLALSFLLYFPACSVLFLSCCACSCFVHHKLAFHPLETLPPLQSIQNTSPWLSAFNLSPLGNYFSNGTPVVAFWLFSLLLSGGLSFWGLL